MDAADTDDDPTLRPRSLADFGGQRRVGEQLHTAVTAARKRGQVLGHVLLLEPPGLGKTTLAQICAAEMGGASRSVTAPSIARPGDMASVPVSLTERNVLLLEEIHRLPPVAAELLYSAMEDRVLNIIAGAEPGCAQAVTIPLPAFTLVGATTRPGMLAQPFRDGFEHDLTLELYSAQALTRVVERSATMLGIALDQGVAAAVAVRSRGTPRVANRLLRRVRDHMAIEGVATLDDARRAFAMLGVDDDGLEPRDREYLDLLRGRYRGRPVGLRTISAALGVDARTIEDMVEPWLLRLGHLERTERGRVAA